MIMNGNDKGQSMAAIILSKMKDGKRADTLVKPEVAMGESDDDQALNSAAEDMLHAIQSNDPRGMVEAMKAFADLYEPSDDSDDDKDE